jgi:hypothetical protein
VENRWLSFVNQAAQDLLDKHHPETLIFEKFAKAVDYKTEHSNKTWGSQAIFAATLAHAHNNIHYPVS